MTEEKLSDLERECLSHLLSYLRGLTNAREFWYLVALEQEHAASKDALQMMEHVGKHEQPYDPVAAKKDHPGLIFCSVPGCGRDGDEYINGEWYCRLHKTEVEVQG